LLEEPTDNGDEGATMFYGNKRATVVDGDEGAVGVDDNKESVAVDGDVDSTRAE
jgi:hypothetical protein